MVNISLQLEILIISSFTANPIQPAIGYFEELK
jgi:hypothetical protein